MVATTDFVQRECLALAKTLERFITPRVWKRTAATLLRNAGTEKPHCNFCGLADGVELHESPIHPTARICNYCVWYIATKEIILRKNDDWERLKHFAP